MRCEGMAEQVRVDAARLQSGLLGKPAQDEECARSRQRTALRIEEELGPVPLVEIRPPAREIPPQRLDRLAPDRHDALLRALAGAADDALLEVDTVLRQSDGLAHAEPGAVEELDERPVAQGARRGSCCGLDEALRLTGRERPRQSSPPF